MSAVDFFSKKSNQIIDDREISNKSSSEDDADTDLGGFIVSDDEVEYEEGYESPLDESLVSKIRKRHAPTTKLSRLVEMGTGSCTVIGRDLEIQQILSMLLIPASGMRPLLIGPKGIGKNSIIEKLSRDERLNGRKIYLVDCCQMVADMYGKDRLEIRKGLQALSKTAETSIIYFRDIDKFMVQESISEYMQWIFSTNAQFIASIADNDSDETSKSISILRDYNFNLIKVAELQNHEVVQIVKNYIKTNTLLNYCDDAIKLAVTLSGKHVPFYPQPLKTLNVIHECAAWNYLQKQGTASTSHETLSSTTVAEFISTKSGIPPEDLQEDSLFNVQRFCERLNKKIVGQEYAIKLVSANITSFKMGFNDPTRSRGVFLFVGPPGVGKTELATQLAKELFQSEKNFYKVDCANYSSDFSVSNLTGASNGLVGYESGGSLTNPLIENPYRVVLLDEFEKAHDEVRKIFLPAFDTYNPSLGDMKNSRADCTKAVFVLTTNVGSDQLIQLAREGNFDPDRVIEVIRPLLEKEFSPELCNRFKIIPFQPITEVHHHQLIEVELMRMKEYLHPQRQIVLEWTAKFMSNLSRNTLKSNFSARKFRENVYEVVTGILTNASIKQGQNLQGRLILDVDGKGAYIIKKSGKRGR